MSGQHGLLLTEVFRGRRTLRCDCGWRTMSAYPTKKNVQRQLEQLRGHVISTWKE